MHAEPEGAADAEPAPGVCVAALGDADALALCVDEGSGDDERDAAGLRVEEREPSGEREAGALRVTVPSAVADTVRAPEADAARDAEPVLLPDAAGVVDAHARGDWESDALRDADAVSERSTDALREPVAQVDTLAAIEPLAVPERLLDAVLDTEGERDSEAETDGATEAEAGAEGIGVVLCHAEVVAGPDVSGDGVDEPHDVGDTVDDGDTPWLRDSVRETAAERDAAGESVPAVVAVVTLGDGVVLCDALVAVLSDAAADAGGVADPRPDNDGLPAVVPDTRGVTESLRLLPSDGDMDGDADGEPVSGVDTEPRAVEETLADTDGETVARTTEAEPSGDGVSVPEPHALTVDERVDDSVVLTVPESVAATTVGVATVVGVPDALGDRLVRPDRDPERDESGEALTVGERELATEREDDGVADGEPVDDDVRGGVRVGDALREPVAVAVAAGDEVRRGVEEGVAHADGVAVGGAVHDGVPDGHTDA